MSAAAQRAVFDAISINGIYERDLLFKLMHRFSQRQIEDALLWLSTRRFIKKAGDTSRPIYVRMEKAKVVYSNILPLDPGTEDVLLKMHSNFRR